MGGRHDLSGVWADRFPERLAVLGMGLPEAFLSEPTESFGWQMIVALTAQLDGKVQVATDAGTSVAITCRERR